MKSRVGLLVAKLGRFHGLSKFNFLRCALPPMMVMLGYECVTGGGVLASYAGRASQLGHQIWETEIARLAQERKLAGRWREWRLILMFGSPIIWMLDPLIQQRKPVFKP